MKKIAHIGLGILKLLGLIVLVMVINGIPMLFLAKGQNLPIYTYTEILLVLAYLVLVFFAIRTLWRRYQTHISKDVKVLSFSWRDLGKALLFFLVARVVAVVGTYLNILLTGQSTTSNDNALQNLGKIMSVDHIFFALLYVMTVAVIAPIIEELVFRGFATIFFFEKDQKIVAALITSIIFALPHISKWTEFPLYFAMGLVLYAAFARRGNLKDSIAVHILNNTPAAIIMLIAMFQ